MVAAAEDAEPMAAASASAVEDELTTADLVEVERLLLPGTPTESTPVTAAPAAMVEDGAGRLRIAEGFYWTSSGLRTAWRSR